MKRLREKIMIFLAMLPISSIAFAAEYNLQVEPVETDAQIIEDDFLKKLEENQLPLKYYLYLKEHKITSSEKLNSKQNLKHKQKLIDEFIRDYKDPFARTAGEISAF